jgi:hypothetical protein
MFDIQYYNEDIYFAFNIKKITFLLCFYTAVKQELMFSSSAVVLENIRISGIYLDTFH